MVKKRILSIVLIFAVLLTSIIAVKQNHHVEYFKKGAFGVEVADKVYNPAYSSDLKVLKEPSLYEMNRFTSKKTYRIMYEPPFENCYIIRICLDSESEGKMFYKVLSGKHVIVNKVFDLDRTTIALVNQEIKNVKFWKEESIYEYKSLDGAQWIFEGVEWNNYHFISRDFSNKGSLESLIALFNQLAAEASPGK